MKRFLQFSALVVLSSSILTPAYAQELDENGQKLKAMFQEMIDATSEASTNNLSSLEFDGDVSVEKAGNYYAVTLPYATLNYNDGAKFEIGLIAINAAAHENPDEWKMTFALPTPMAFVNEEGKKDFQINIGGQRAAGVWNSSLGYFSKLDAQYQDIEMKDPENSFIFTLPQIKAVYDLNADDNQKWSGPVYFTFNNMNLNIPEQGGEVLRIGDINLNMEMFDYNPAGFTEYQQRIEQLILQSENPDTQTPPDIAGIFDAFIEMIGNGFTSEYQIKNLVVRGSKEQENFETVNIESAGFGMDFTGFLNNDVTIELRMGYDGFEISPTPEDMPDLAPETLNFDLSLQNIPFREIADMGKNTAEMAMTNPQMAQMAGMSVLFKLPALLSQAGTSLVIDNNHFGNEIYHATIDGKIITDLQAANSATADITARLRGLDAVIQSLNAQMSENQGQGENQSFIQQLLMGLMMAKGFATVENDEDGKPVHVYKFIMNPQGQMLLNDQDMSALTGGITGAPLGGPVGGQTGDAPVAAPAE
ncbi:MAG: hypothetical protein ACLFR0_04345 [Alphaproteobacteria bacterium]